MNIHIHIHIILCFIYWYIGFNIYKLTKCFVTIKEGKIYKAIAIIGLSIIGSVVIFVSDIENVTWYLIGYFILMLICYKESIIKKISVIMILYPIIISLNMFFIELPVRIDETSDYLYGYIYILRYFAIALSWKMIYRFTKDRVSYAKEYLTNQIWILIDIICLASFITTIATIVFTEIGRVYQAFVVMPICLISNLAILFAMKLVIKSVRTQSDNNIYKLQSRYYNMLELEQQQIRKIKHDMNNHLQIIGSYINENNIEEAKDYFQSISNVVNDISSRKFCENKIINAVINSKYHNIKENKIKNDINISIENIVNIDDMDLCSIFANTLDNAIEASMKIKDYSQRYISVKARYDKGYFVYNIKNTKSNAVFMEGNKYISDKEDKKANGWGISNVKDIVAKYKGEMDSSYTENEFCVIIIIPIN